MTLRKLVPCSGIALVALIAVAVVLGGSTPSSTADGVKVASYYDEHQASMFIVSFIFGLAAFAAVLFASWLARSLRSDDGTSVWDRVLLGGGVMFAAALGFVGAANFALVDSPKKVSAPALQALNLLMNDSWLFWNAALGVFMLGAAGACLTSPAAHRWLGRIAIILGVALFIPFADFFALLASGLWIIAATVVLARRASAPAYGRAAEATA
ncbi:MAG TPA: hypothetical protein VLB89_05985 [Gaiellaceae bacterium]|nr:hypothetical protein [Gaiellaceae bacterium]